LYGVLYVAPVSDWSSTDDVPGESTTRLGSVTVGMKFLYEDDPGYAFPILTLGIKDQGSEQLNHDYFKLVINKVAITMIYWKWKEQG
jgi:hypothetical protein